MRVYLGHLYVSGLAVALELQVEEELEISLAPFVKMFSHFPRLRSF